MRKLQLILTTIFVMGYIIPTLAQANFSTSLHALRGGKPHFYNKVENGGTGGFETLTNVPISQIGCVECHDAKDANGIAYPTNYVPGCADCHATNTAPFPGPVTQADCLGCHSREAAVINNATLSDVHRTAGKTCMFCHKSNDMHGTGTQYNSMFEPGAISTDCSDTGCHTSLPSTHAANDPHGGKLHCTSCHASTNLTCYNCHFESQLVHNKRPLKQVTGFIFLVNRTKDNKVHPATFQSLSYQGKTWVTFGPSVAHTIVKTGARTCINCHQNMGGNIPAIVDYNADGLLKFGTWNSADSTLSTLKGIIPMPSDWQRSLKLDYLVYNGNPSDAVAPSKNWSLIDDVTDGSHMLYATPLTNSQMAKLGMDTSWTVIPVELISFTASTTGIEVRLVWSTATELNNYGFEIQRKAIGGEFATIAFVKGQGTTTQKSEYSFSDKNLDEGRYFYRLKQMDYGGQFSCSQIVEVEIRMLDKFTLEQNSPNPWNPTTTIGYRLKERCDTKLMVLNSIGEEVAVLVNEEQDKGYHKVEFDGSKLSSGVYFYKLVAKDFVSVKKMILVK